MKKICFVSADAGGCGHYRSYLPAYYLSKRPEDFNVSYSIGFIPDKLNHYLDQDIVILQRHNHPDLLRFIDDMHSKGKQVWFDVDDMLWDIPSTNNARKGWDKKSIKDMTNIIKKCNIVTTSTEPLALFLKRINPNTHVIPNKVEDNFFPLSTKHNNDKVRIMWAGSSTHAGDFTSDIQHAIKHVLTKYDIEFYFVGYLPDEFNNTKYGDKVRYVEPVPVDAYIETIKLLKPDISIMPLVDNYFNTCKSNLKYLESTIAGAVSIGSDVYPYSNTIQHGTTGLLAKKAKDWIAALELFIEDEEYRRKVYISACDDVAENYTWTESNILKNLLKYKELANENNG